MVLSQKQIDDLNKVSNKLPLQRLINYAKDGTITEAVLSQLSEMSAERRAQLLAIIKAPKPDAQEQQEWSAIMPRLKQKDEALKQLLDAYVSHWEASMPLGNHVDEAKKVIAEIDSLLEDNAWDELDKNDSDALAAYLRR